MKIADQYSIDQETSNFSMYIPTNFRHNASHNSTFDNCVMGTINSIHKKSQEQLTIDNSTFMNKYLNVDTSETVINNTARLIH